MMEVTHSRLMVSVALTLFFLFPCRSMRTAQAQEVKELKGMEDGARSSAADGRVTVCTWRGNRKAALTFGIDDGVPRPTPVMAKVFNENDVKATWYPVVKDWTNWALWVERIREGHEVGSHTRTHPKLKDCSDAQKIEEIEASKTIMEKEIRKHLPDYKCLTFCHPYGLSAVDKASIDLIKKHYIAAKDGRSALNSVSPDMFALCCQGSRTATPLATHNRWVDDVLKSGGWLVETYHGIQGYGGWEATPLDVFSAHVKYAAGKKDMVWIDTIAEIAKYIYERDSASVKVVTDGREKMVIDLADTVDDQVFDAPLTLKVLVRPGWSSPVTVTQNARREKVEVVREAGKKFVYVDAIPDRGNVVLEPSDRRHSRTAAKPARERKKLSPEEERASSLLKVAREMQKSGLGRTNVQRVLEQILQRYPGTKAAEQAKQMLKKLK